MLPVAITMEDLPIRSTIDGSMVHVGVGVSKWVWDFSPVSSEAGPGQLLL